MTQKKKTIGCGIIGCGNISGVYFNGAKTFEVLNIVACADLNEATAQAKAEEHGCLAQTVDELLANPDVDLVINLTLPAVHAEVSIAALNAGKIPYGLANQNLLSEISNFDYSEQKHFLPVAIIDPGRRVAKQIPHLRKLHATSRFYALKIQGTIIHSKVSDLLDTGSAFLDLAAEWNVPFLIHSSILPDDIWSQASDILRVVESRPDVRFLLAHSCRFHKPSLDRIAELPNAWFDCSAHRIHCDLAERNQPTVAVVKERFPANYSNPAKVLLELAKAYLDKLIWGTDSPYYSWIENSHGKKLRLVSSYADEWACVEALPESMIKAITQTNTLNWLGINADRI